MTNSTCEIQNNQCAPCEGGVDKNTPETNLELMANLHKDWQYNKETGQLQRSYKFKNFAKTMFFVNSVAYIADQQFHHPDIEFGYNYCHINYSTHSVEGLTNNDFICAAMIDKLV